MIAIAIDDEPIALDIVAAHASKVPFVTLNACFTNAFEAITYLQQHKVDLIFLDIKMPDINGIDFVKALGRAPMIIFTTAYSEHAVQSFELDAVDYLLKPFALSRFLKACHKAKELFDLRQQAGDIPQRYVFVKDGYEQVKVFLEDIRYIEASGNYTLLHLKDGKRISTRITITEILALLPPKEFLRIHRAYIVAKNKISKFDRSQVWIDETSLPVGATYAQLVDFNPPKIN